MYQWRVWLVFPTITCWTLQKAREKHISLMIVFNCGMCLDTDSEIYVNLQETTHQNLVKVWKVTPLVAQIHWSWGMLHIKMCGQICMILIYCMIIVYIYYINFSEPFLASKLRCCGRSLLPTLEWGQGVIVERKVKVSCVSFSGASQRLRRTLNQQSFTFFFVICFWFSSCLIIDMDQVLSLELTMIWYGCFPFIHPHGAQGRTSRCGTVGHRGSSLMMVDFIMADDGKTMKNHMNCLFELLFLYTVFIVVFIVSKFDLLFFGADASISWML